MAFLLLATRLAIGSISGSLKGAGVGCGAGRCVARPSGPKFPPDPPDIPVIDLFLRLLLSCFGPDEPIYLRRRLTDHSQTTIGKQGRQA